MDVRTPTSSPVTAAPPLKPAAEMAAAGPIRLALAIEPARALREDG